MRGIQALLAVFAAIVTPLEAKAQQQCCAWAREIVDEVRASAYPELAGAGIAVYSLASRSDFFQARVEWRSFLCRRRLAYVILANPRLLSEGAPPDGMRAIVAHELAHVRYYRRGSRVRLTGLIRLLSPGWRARFERDADREAIRRGFGPGLKLYRQWLYQNVPPRKLPGKLRDYLSPDEIDRSML